ncbi:recombinase family protein [Mycolicibacterium sp. CBMA 226]|uniref:recombinase family protein n=1 Tax=Mycolicibacterium sp. CBMA 226 TaxID=2606611 RepID=UPI0012DF212C|nr:recombinase family protein [Mycolicibacterium sp. CBMA 226]MUL77217.1 hypothetical protein [Mycolicibacterium sp. CBMA 226]
MTSPESQLEECRDYCERRGWEIVDVTEDMDVSGSVNLFDRKVRPNLSRWLAGEAVQFDVISEGWSNPHTSSGFGFASSPATSLR